MKKIFFAILAVIVIGIVLIFSFCHPQKVQQSTIQEIIENAVALDKTDTYVTLTGTVASQISRKRFWFEDGTGQIIIEVKSSLLPMVPSSNQIEIEIRGEVDCEIDDGEGVKIEVKEIIFDDAEEEFTSI